MMTTFVNQVVKTATNYQIYSTLCNYRKTLVLLRRGNEIVLRDQFRLKNSKSTDDETDSDDENKISKKKEDNGKSETKKPSIKAAISSSILDKLLSMKVAGKRDDGEQQSINLAKPTGKWKQLKKKMLEEYEAEKELEKVGLNKAIVSAVKEVATSLSGDRERTESELLRKLKDHGLETEAEKTGGAAALNLSDMVTGMKIDRVKSKRESRSMTRRGEVDSDATGHTRTPSYLRHVPMEFRTNRPSERRMSNVDLFGANPLNIFTVMSTGTSRPPRSLLEKDIPRLDVWQRLERRELDLLVLHPPANGFEEMITWTKQGKLWKFPIDNEQGMDEEAKVGFHEHVFLEPLIAVGFPNRGPIRHFMELVIVGLSKNPYLTVERKKEHIDWFRQYFKEKEDVLKDVVVMN